MNKIIIALIFLISTGIVSAENKFVVACPEIWKNEMVYRDW